MEKARADAKISGSPYFEKNGLLIVAVDSRTLDARVGGKDPDDFLLGKMRVEALVNGRCNVSAIKWLSDTRAGISVADSSCINPQ